tara:strand:- start:534 stop:1124 length:591 start_codon:yes stop_codon:yes gene_type:complete
MKLLPVILCACLLASCARTPSAVVVAPPVTVDVIETVGVDKASKATRAAVRDILDASSKTRVAADRLKEEIGRVEEFATLQIYANELTDALDLSEEKERIALSVIDNQDVEMGLLKSHVMAQSGQISRAKVVDTTLREQVALGQEVRDKLLISKVEKERLAKHRLIISLICFILLLWISRKLIYRGAKFLFTGLPI